MRKFQVTVNGNTYEVEVEEVGGNFASSQVATQKEVVPVQQVAPVAIPSHVEKIVAPMPGKIVDVKVSVGQQIKEGDLVAVLEAMKMENEVFANATGTVASVNVSTGSMVEANDVIVMIQ